jgi:hypothetical protein
VDLCRKKREGGALDQPDFGRVLVLKAYFCGFEDVIFSKAVVTNVVLGKVEGPPSY